MFAPPHWVDFTGGRYAYTHFYTGARANALGEQAPPADLETEFTAYVRLWHQYKLLRDGTDAEIAVTPPVYELAMNSIMAVPQIVVAGLLEHWNRPLYAGIVAASVVLQFVCMARLLKDPKKYAPWYNATGVTLYVLGMLASAIAVRGGLS